MGCIKLEHIERGYLKKIVFSSGSAVERSGNASKKRLNTYRYGFQGQERDDEIKGEGNSVNYKYRMHDPRVGRFFAVDPLASKYPYYSPYAFSGNRVIDAYELEGLEPVVENDIMVGYSVQKGQGYWSIANDINNPATQKKYGYSLMRVFTADEIEAINVFSPQHGQRDFGYILKSYDYIRLVDAELHQVQTGFTKKADRKLNWYRNRIKKLWGKINRNEARMDRIDSKPGERAKNPTSRSEPYDPNGGFEVRDLIESIKDSREHFDLQGKNKYYKKSIRQYNKSINYWEEYKQKIVSSMNDDEKSLNKIVQKLNDLKSQQAQESQQDLDEGCFVGGTKISMADGSLRNIEDVLIGDTVKTYNTDLGVVENEIVLEVIQPLNDDFVRIAFDSGIKNMNTDDHPYYVVGKGWCSANPEKTQLNYGWRVKMLEIGDRCLNLDSESIDECVVFSIFKENGTRVTYNLSKVSNNNNFFANGILVHNKALEFK